MDDRFTPSIRVVHARQFIEVASLLQQGRTDDAWAKFRQYAVDFGNLGGALDVALRTPADPVDMRQLVWGDIKRIELPAFGVQVIAFRLEVPAGATATQAGYTSVFEYRGDPALREMTVSTTPGDFFAPIARSVGMQASIFWSVTPGQGDATLTPGRTYYFNVRNVDRSGVNRPAMVETFWPR